MLQFYAVLAQTGAAIAAINAKALHRAGMLSAVEIGAMHELLQQLAETAGTPDQQAVVDSLRGTMPKLD